MNNKTTSPHIRLPKAFMSKKGLPLIALCLGFLIFPATSFAGYPVSVVNCVSMSGTVTGVLPNCASEATLNAQYQYLSTGRQTSIVGAITGEGVIELLRKQNDSAAQAVSGDVQYLPNGDLADRQRDYSLKTRDMIAEVYTPITEEACRQATRNAGALGGGGGGGAPADTPETKQPDIDANNEERLLEPASNDTALANLVAGDQKNSCTAADVKNQMVGCESVGATPGANTRFYSLLQKYSNPPFKFNFSIPIDKNDLAYKAAKTYMVLNSPRNAPPLPKASKTKVAGKKYLAFQRKYHASAMAVSNFYSHSLAFTLARRNADPFVKQVWLTGLNDEYAELYPGREVPKSPSHREIMHMFVDRQFGKKVTGEDLGNSKDEVYLLNRNLELQKINAYLSLKIFEQLEYNGMIQAQLLSHQLDPVNRKDLEELTGSD